MSTLNLIWQTNLKDQNGFEVEYITKVLFSKFSIINHFDELRYESVVDNSLIIYSCDSREIDPNFIGYLNKFLKRGFFFFLLHLSNENLNHNCWYYSKANYVFRSYFDPSIKQRNVMFLPLGFQSGYFNKAETITACNERDIDVTFIGHPKSDRFEMLQQIEKLEPVFTHKTREWNCSSSLSIEECIEVYRRTKYAPCPMGNAHQDSFRLFEVLEWGCVPILKRLHNGIDYLTPVFGKHSLTVIDSWEEIPEIVNQANYCELMQLTRQWYIEFKTGLQNKIQDIINNGGLKSNGSTLRYLDIKASLHRKYRVIKALLK